MNELITDLRSYLNETELQKHQLAELNALVKKISTAAHSISSQEVCEKIILFAETLTHESPEKNRLHDILYTHSPEVYLAIIGRAQTQLNLLNKLESVVEDRTIERNVRKKLSKFLETFKTQFYALSALMRKILSWMEDFEKSHAFDLDEDLSWKETIREMLKEFSPEMDFKLAVFDVLCESYPENNFERKGYLDKLSPSEFCSAVYGLMEKEECTSSSSAEKKEKLLANVFEMEKKYFETKYPFKENDHPLRDMNTLVCALNHCLTVTPGFQLMQQNLDATLTRLVSKELSSGDTLKSLEDWAENAARETQDPNLKIVLKEFAFKMSVASLLQQEKFRCSNYMLEKVREALLGEKTVEESAKCFTVPPNVSSADTRLFSTIKLHCREYLRTPQKYSQKVNLGPLSIISAKG